MSVTKRDLDEARVCIADAISSVTHGVLEVVAKKFAEHREEREALEQRVIAARICDDEQHIEDLRAIRRLIEKKMDKYFPEVQNLRDEQLKGIEQQCEEADVKAPPHGKSTSVPIR